MCTKKGRHDAQWELAGKASDHTQGLQLVVEAEPVTGFHLDRRGAERRQTAESGTGEVEQHIFRTRTQIAHRLVNAASAAGDLHVIESTGAHLVLFVSRPAEDAMRVRIDESGHQNMLTTIDFSRPAELIA